MNRVILLFASVPLMCANALLAQDGMWAHLSRATVTIAPSEVTFTYLLRHDTSIEDGEWDLVAFGNSKTG
jgi:hypothetical protein